MLWTPVPEASVNEHSDLGWTKDDVRTTSNAMKWPIIHSVTETGPVKEPPNGELWSRIPRPVRLHDSAAPRR